MVEEIVREDRGDTTILSVPERLHAGLNDAVARVFKQLAADGRFKVVVDCKGLRFLNSVILEVLVRFRQEATDHGGDLKFANVSPLVECVFRASNLDRIFLSYPSVDEAMDAF